MGEYDDDRDCLWDADLHDLVEVMWERTMNLLFREEEGRGTLSEWERTTLTTAANLVDALHQSMSRRGLFGPPPAPPAGASEEPEPEPDEIDF